MLGWNGPVGLSFPCKWLLIVESLNIIACDWRFFLYTMYYHLCTVAPARRDSVPLLFLHKSLAVCQSMTLHIELCTFPTHLRSSSTYSDALHIGLCMLHNSALPPASMPPHVPPLLVCLFVYLCHWCTCCLFCLFVSPSRSVLLIDR